MGRRNIFIKLGRKNGQALILAYMVIVSLSILSVSLLDKVISERNLLERQKLEKEAFYFAEGGVEDAIDQFISAIANFQIQPDVSRFPASGSIMSTYAASAGFPSGAQVAAVVTEAVEGEDMRHVTDPDGIEVGVKTYVVNAVCQHPQNNNITVSLNQLITLRVIYTFQHAVFYNDDLEIIPGPNMTFTGRIHSNKDMYLDSENTLTINSEYVHSAGNVYNQRKDTTTPAPGDVRIKKLGTGSYVNMNGMDSDDPNWITESQNYWKGTVKNSVHGVTKLSTPVVGSIQPGGYYSSQAGVTIENETISVGGAVLVEGTDMPADTIETRADFYNNREGKYVSMTYIDLKKMAGYAPGDSEGHPSFPNRLPSNGLIYATNNESGAMEQPGVMLVNGSQIYSTKGLTVVSNDPIYIKGDYNTVNKKPTSVICDSVNLLSNSWIDDRSDGSLNDRDATATTFNTAFIAGVNNTTTGHYNGGLENYPRLHEDWSGITLTIKGSFVELWNSQIAQGLWIYGSPQYKAPGRSWSYDSDFNVNNMPPFTPWAVEARRGAWWKE